MEGEVQDLEAAGVPLEREEDSGAELTPLIAARQGREDLGIERERRGIVGLDGWSPDEAIAIQPAPDWNVCLDPRVRVPGETHAWPT